MTVTAGAHFNSGDDRGNDGDIVIPNVTTPASGTFAIAVMIHQHQGIETVTGITFGATGATFAEAITGLGPSSRRNSIWRSLNAPANTTADITITMSGNNRPKGADALILSSDTGNIAVIGKSAFSGSNTAITGSVNPLGAGHELIGCCTYGTGGGSVAPTAPTVELWDLDASGPGPDSDYWTARRSTTGTGSHTIAGTITGTQGWHMVIAEVTDDPPPPNFATVANGHKIYNNGSVSDAVVLAGGSSGTPASVVEGGTYQVRVGVQNTSGAARNFNPQLQYRLNGGSWVNCNAASVVARVVASENVLEGTATTQRSTTGTFTAGSFEDTDGLIAAYSVPNNNFTEVVYTVWIDPAQVVASDTLEFRVDDQASAPPSGTLHLYCTIVAAALPGIVAHDESVVSVENACSRWMWVDTNDNLYVITEGGWNQNHDAGKPPAVIRKSSDGGLTWRVIDFKDFLATGNGDLEGTHVVDLGSGEWMIVHIETGDDVYGDIFRTSDHATTPDNWVTPLSTLIQDGADSLSALMTHVTAAARQNGQVLAVYSNELTTAPPNPDRLFWNLRDTVPAWDASPGTELESTASTDYTGPVMSPGLSSRSLLCFCDTTNNVLYFRWASSADPPVWDARVQVNTNGTTVANSLNGPVMAFVRYDDTNDYHAVVWLDNSNNLQLNTIKWNGSDYDVGTTPTQINTVSVESNWPGATETEDLDNQGANGTGVADPATGTVHMLYADATNRDLYYNTWTEAGGAGTEALEFNPSGSEGIGFVDAVVYNSKVGYVYELVVGNATPPGRGMFYDEITLSAAQTLTWSAAPASASVAGTWTVTASGAATLAWQAALATASATDWLLVGAGAVALVWSSAAATAVATDWALAVAGAATLAWETAAATAQAVDWVLVAAGAATLLWAAAVATSVAGTWLLVGAGAVTLAWSVAVATALAGTWLLVVAGAATLTWSSAVATALAGTWVLAAAGAAALIWSGAAATGAATDWILEISGALALVWEAAVATSTAGTWTLVAAGAAQLVWEAAVASAVAGTWLLVVAGAATLLWSAAGASSTAADWAVLGAGAVALTWSVALASAVAQDWVLVVVGAATLTWEAATAAAAGVDWSLVGAGAVALVWSDVVASAGVAGSWVIILSGSTTLVWDAAPGTAAVAGAWVLLAAGAVTLTWNAAAASGAGIDWVLVAAGATTLLWAAAVATGTAQDWTLAAAGAAVLTWNAAAASALAGAWLLAAAGAVALVWNAATATGAADDWVLILAGALQLIWEAAVASGAAGTWLLSASGAGTLVWEAATSTAVAGAWLLVGSGAVTLTWEAAVATAVAGTWLLVVTGAAALVWASGLATSEAGTWLLLGAGAAALVWSGAASTAAAGAWLLVSAAVTLVWTAASATATAGSWSLLVAGAAVLVWSAAASAGTAVDWIVRLIGQLVRAIWVLDRRAHGQGTITELTNGALVGQEPVTLVVGEERGWPQ